MRAWPCWLASTFGSLIVAVKMHVEKGSIDLDVVFFFFLAIMKVGIKAISFPPWLGQNDEGDEQPDAFAL